MLSSSLKELEQAGLIIREQFMEIPLRFEYKTTDACKELIPILGQLAIWGMKLKPMDE
ncbi:winged helix-turn-helix transcriptional regulator [Clostridium sporogenes]|uniref:winged helix-turn-helix transcriptional regulator n=1 Tax=Clostridium sporogenes TaxID=1509 RepID=UPI00313C208E